MTFDPTIELIARHPPDSIVFSDLPPPLSIRVDVAFIPRAGPSLDRNSYHPREDRTSAFGREGYHVASTNPRYRMMLDTFQGRFALTTASAIGIHVAACTSRARTQVIRRTNGTGREMPRLASPMIFDVAAALGRIVLAWGSPPPPPPPPLPSPPPPPPPLLLVYLFDQTCDPANGPRDDGPSPPVLPSFASRGPPRECGAPESFVSFVSAATTCGSAVSR